jgi:hypothetical protein
VKYLTYDAELQKLRSVAARLKRGTLMADDAADLATAIEAIIRLIQRTPCVEDGPRRATDPPATLFTDRRSGFRWPERPP